MTLSPYELKELRKFSEAHAGTWDFEGTLFRIEVLPNGTMSVARSIDDSNHWLEPFWVIAHGQLIESTTTSKR